MGSGIAEVRARAGLAVPVCETGPENLKSGCDAALGRICFTTDLVDCADRDMVIEAVAEDEHIKSEVFASLDKIVAQGDAILAINTSSIPVMKLAMATGRPEQVGGTHFFNPVPVMPLVEIVPSLLAGNQARWLAEAFVAGRLGKQATRSQDRAGFIVNSLLVPYAVRHPHARIRHGHGRGHRQRHDSRLRPLYGPLRLANLIGLDTVKAIADSMCEEFKEQLRSPPSLLLRMVDARLLGKKSGRGFHDYAR
ncbi:3-hydroxybutyryl-CoA dehydrogenase [Streptomyces sp. 6-11-2]|nr:3-hydroxybutyryl-CoA dehydrogenase [Streptomyces sp. 6-11-2]